MSNKFVVVDLETTGNSVKKGDKIIQFAAVVIENNKIVDQFSTLLCPNQPIPIFIEELTGITDEMVKDAPSFQAIAPKVVDLLDGAYFVAHNVLFDLSFLQDELIEAGFEGFYGPVLDTVEMARILFPTNDSYKLSDIANQFELTHDRPHQADSDAYVTAELLLILFDKLRSLPIKTLKQLHLLSDALKGELNEIIEELILEKESTLERLPIHLEEFLGICIRKSEEIDCDLEQPIIEYPVHHKEKEKLFLKTFPQFDSRLGQYQMMDIIYDSFLNEQHALIEAGTGIGKSLAYLLPSIYISLLKNEPVVISTYTTQLQEQLLQKDIPLLRRAVSFPFSTVVLKGKSHYIALDKFVRTLSESDDNYDTILTKMQILVWLTQTITGDRDEINLSSGGQLYWHKIKNADPISQEKAWRNKDFYYKTKNKAESANLIITNHSLLMTDLISDHPVLPEFQYCILDEGHHMEEVASKHLGNKLDYAYLRFLLHKMGLYDQKLLLFQMENLLDSLDRSKTVLLHTFEMNRLMTELQYEMDEFFKLMAATAKKAKKSSHQTRISYRLFLSDKNKDSNVMKAEAERFLFLLRDYLNATKARYDLIKDNRKNKGKKSQYILSELLLWMKDIEKVIEYLREMFIHPDTNLVTWIELDTRSWQNNTTIYSQPVSMSKSLKERFFDQKRSVIITSATLSVKGSFHYTMKSLGLDEETSINKKIASPFNYKEQLKFIIANDLPDINYVSTEEYVSAISEHIISIAEATKGRLLILFTSNDMLRKTYDLIKESGFLQDYSILAQGITGGSRERLVRNFQRFEKSILLGTNSFWEGIDVPGEDLSCLVMVRLPFSPPDDPLIDAKCKEVKDRGGNPFYDYSLPEAVIRFKQGFGRLIRTKKDKGIFVIFDRRVISTQYGKVFLDSLPNISTEELNIEQTVQLVKNWL